MTPSPRVWIATFVALVFLIGGMAGVVVDRLWLLDPPRFAGPGLGTGPGPGRGLGPGDGPGLGSGLGPRRGGPGGQSPERVVADLDGQLSLTSEQEAAIFRILESWRPRVQQLQNATRQQFVDMQQQLREEVAKTLTPEQLERFREISNDQLGAGGRPGGPGPGRGPGRPGR